MLTKKLPRIISFHKAANPRHGVLYYSTVLSRSRSTRVNHVVNAAKRGRRLRFRCSCESASFRPHTSCIRMLAVQRRMRKASR